jgi:hypothetical protein
MNDVFQNLAGLDALKAWFAHHSQFFQQRNVLAPRAVVLAGDSRARESGALPRWWQKASVGRVVDSHER